MKGLEVFTRSDEPHRIILFLLFDLGNSKLRNIQISYYIHDGSYLVSVWNKKIVSRNGDSIETYSRMFTMDNVPKTVSPAVVHALNILDPLTYKLR